VVLISIVAVLVPAAAASEAAPADKPAVLARWTQTSAASSAAWYTASRDREPWAAYGFDWATDYCSASPDQPLGFDFRRSCHRHDFGYRNHKAAGIFAANKASVDDAFYADLKRVCATHPAVLRPTCLSLAWTYYSAVVVFGKVIIDDTALQRAARMKAQALQMA
jgi:hypothetical protein